MLHYHGTPITPRTELLKMKGRSFCVSFAAPWDMDTCISIGSSVMIDNGAFSVWKRGIKTPDWNKYYQYVESKLNHPHWAIVPDVICGSESDNDNLISQWPHNKRMSAVVWHTNESLDRLVRLAESGFGYVCFGSTSEYEPGTDSWCYRMDEAFTSLEDRGLRPWVHMLRGLSQAGKRWPFASADSTNIARNFKNKGREQNPQEMAERIDSVQCPVFFQKTNQLTMKFNDNVL